MPVRAVLNFVYVLLKPKGDGVTQEDIAAYDAELYADPAEEEIRLSLIQQMGG
jgi:hypothetical protein